MQIFKQMSRKWMFIRSDIIYCPFNGIFPATSYYTIPNHYIDQCPILYTNGYDKRILTDSNMP